MPPQGGGFGADAKLRHMWRLRANAREGRDAPVLADHVHAVVACQQPQRQGLALAGFVQWLDPLHELADIGPEAGGRRVADAAVRLRGGCEGRRLTRTQDLVQSAQTVGCQQRIRGELTQERRDVGAQLWGNDGYAGASLVAVAWLWHDQIHQRALP